MIVISILLYILFSERGGIENFDLASDGGTIKGNLTTTGEIITASKITGGILQAKNSNGGYQLIAGGATDAGGVMANSLDLHAYNGDGSWKTHLATFRNNNVTDFNGKINVAGRDILAEIDALKAGNTNKGGTDTNKAIDDLGKIASQLLNSGNLTVPGNLTVNGGISGPGWKIDKDGISGPGWKIDKDGNLTLNSIKAYDIEALRGIKAAYDIQTTSALRASQGASGPGWNIDKDGNLTVTNIKTNDIEARGIKTAWGIEAMGNVVSHGSIEARNGSTSRWL